MLKRADTIFEGTRADVQDHDPLLQYFEILMRIEKRLQLEQSKEKTRWNTQSVKLR